VNITLLLMLTVGDTAPGPHRVLMRTELPSGTSVGAHTIDVEVRGEPSTALNALVEVHFEATETGVHWLRFAWDRDEAMLTRIPLRVERQASH
jgi:hypothetical protein